MFQFSGYLLDSVRASTDDWLFPLASLIANLIYGVVLAWEYNGTKIFVPGKVGTGTSISQSSPVKIRESQNLSRRSFIEKGAIALGSLALLATGLDSLLTTSTPVTQPSTNSSATGAGSPINIGQAPAIFDDPRLADLVDSEVTSNDNFYRVAIDIFDPSVDISSWSLQVAGVNGSGKTYTIANLQSLPKTVEYNTFECVSNTIDGNLVSNAKWGGVKCIGSFRRCRRSAPRCAKCRILLGRWIQRCNSDLQSYVKQLHGCLRDERCDPAAKTWLSSKGSNSRSVWNDERQMGQENPDHRLELHGLLADQRLVERWNCPNCRFHHYPR